MSSSGNKESLFGIDFDINAPMNNEVKHQKSRTVMKPGDKYPMVFKAMTRKDFQVEILATFRNFLFPFLSFSFLSPTNKEEIIFILSSVDINKSTEPYSIPIKVLNMLKMIFLNSLLTCLTCLLQQALSQLF